MFALALWLAHLVRKFFTGEFMGWVSEPIESFDKFVWLYLIIIPGVPLVLESQGFYQRPLLGSRRETSWLLLKSCVLATVGVILVMFLFKSYTLARGVIILFGVISFVLVFVSEEILRAAYRSRFGEAHLTKRVILVGAPEDTARMRADLEVRAKDNIEVLREWDINDSTINDLVNLLHETSANSVILNSKHTYFGQVEKAIQACEIEGVEAWLVADFSGPRCRTPASTTSMAGRCWCFALRPRPRGRVCSSRCSI